MKKKCLIWFSIPAFCVITNFNALGSSVNKYTFSKVYDDYNQLDSIIQYYGGNTDRDLKQKYGFYTSDAETQAYYYGWISAVVHIAYETNSLDDSIEQGEYIELTADVCDFIEIPYELKWQQSESDRSGKYRIILAEDSDSWNYDNSIKIRSNDDSFRGVREGDVVTVRGYYMLDGQITNLDVLYDCTLMRTD